MFPAFEHAGHGVHRPSAALRSERILGTRHRRVDRRPHSDIGFKVVDLILGGPIIGGETLSRFFVLHVFVIPALLIGFVGLHLFLVLRLGINEWPMPGPIVRRDSYVKQYEELVHADGEPFMPFAAQKDLLFAGLIILSLLVVAAVEGPIGPNGQPDPTIIQTVPRPDFFFLWLFSLFALLPRWTETFLMLTVRWQ